ncbi:MAG: glycoside hydrolase family 127 protein [Ferruginibacter sp.]|nr:glycoside hydrolase family 127 protein [Ferruginibacter sp.]
MKKVSSVLGLVISLLLIGSDLNAQRNLYTNEFPVSDVKLLESPFKHARDLNIQTLLKYDVDRLLAGYRKEAGLPEKAKIYPNWDGLDGHVGGHYLSALAMNYAATGNTECKKRMDYMIAELKACQDANGLNNPGWGKGYAGAVPNGKKIWSGFQQGDFAAFRAAWVPWYNVHKMYAGLRDAWVYTGNNAAKDLFLKFCDWGINIIARLTDVQMQIMLDNEHGGMNETFADAYQITGDEKYLIAAKRFSHNMLLDAMAAGKDNLDNKHANTQVPKAVGFERIGELAHNATYKNAGRFFWETVTGKRSLAFGGNSRREFFPGVAASYDFVNDVEGPESCNSYNMLKLTEDLFRVHPSAQYADYYERTLYNHILSTQHPEHGGYVYFTPARPRHYRVYSSPNEGMWCCVGSGMENHGKYNQFIYTSSKNSLYLNLFIASELNWKEKKIKLRQQTLFPYEEQTKLTITEGSSSFALMIRYPSWVKEGALKITVNGKVVSQAGQPSSYIALNRLWKKGDVVTIQLPMHNSIEHLPNVPNYIALMHGPILLGAKTGTEDLKGLVAGDSRWGHIAGGKKLPVDKAPVIIENDLSSLAARLKPVPGKALTFTAPGIKMVNPIDVVFQPFYTIHDARYMVYWMTLSDSQSRGYLDSLTIIEQQKLELEKRTIDFVAPGEQQPEADHFIQKENSNTGNYLDEFWRDARNGGWFSYSLSTRNQPELSLVVRYWGNERGNKTFDIFIDDEKLVTENISDKWNQQKFQDVVYPIPASMLNSKERIRVKFQSKTGGSAGAVYYVRLTVKKAVNL